MESGMFIFIFASAVSVVIEIFGYVLGGLNFVEKATLPIGVSLIILYTLLGSLEKAGDEQI